MYLLDISDIVSTYLMLKVDFPSNVDEMWKVLGTFTDGNVNEGTNLSPCFINMSKVTAATFQKPNIKNINNLHKLQ